MKLYYFDVYVRAEPIRMLLNHAKVPFEDVRLSYNQFKTLKNEGKFEFGQLPVIEIEGLGYSQTDSIMRLLGKLHGYYPSPLTDAWKVDSNMQATADIQRNFWSVQKTEQQKQKAVLNQYLAIQLPNYFQAMQRRLEANDSNRHIVGNKMTIADFDMAGFGYSYVLNDANKFNKEQRAVLDYYPLVADYYQQLGEELSDYLKSRPQPRPF